MPRSTSEGTAGNTSLARFLEEAPHHRSQPRPLQSGEEPGPKRYWGIIPSPGPVIQHVWNVFSLSLSENDARHVALPLRFDNP